MRTITISPEALLQMEEYKKGNPKLLVKIISLLVEIANTPFEGTGKPEPLKHELKGKWSRRINDEHRQVYEVKDDTIWLISCKYHYQ
jgi:toxin YoeB